MTVRKVWRLSERFGDRQGGMATVREVWRLIKIKFLNLFDKALHICRYSTFDIMRMQGYSSLFKSIPQNPSYLENSRNSKEIQELNRKYGL